MSTVYREFFFNDHETHQKRLVVVSDIEYDVKSEYFEYISVGAVVLARGRFVNDLTEIMPMVGKKMQRKEQQQQQSGYMGAKVSTLQLQSL